MAANASGSRGPKPGPKARPRSKARRWPRVGDAAATVVLVALAALALLPVLWIVNSAFRTNTAILTRPFALPEGFAAENFRTAWKNAKMGAYFMNSLFASSAAVAAMLVVSSMAAYVLARVRPNAFLSAFFAAGIMIPMQAIVIPAFVIIKGMGLLNTRTGLVVAYIISGLSFGIFVLTGFLRGIPKELEEAATIDGASLSLTFFRIILPLATPALATVGTFIFLQCWNEYLFASVLVSKPALKTITQGIMSLKGTYSINYGVLCAGLAYAVVPVVAVFLALQKQVINGMMAGAVKG